MPDDDTTTTEPTEEEQAADEKLRETDPIRWQLARRDRGAAARRFVAGLAARYTPTNPT